MGCGHAGPTITTIACRTLLQSSVMALPRHGVCIGFEPRVIQQAIQGQGRSLLVRGEREGEEERRAERQEYDQWH